MLRRPSGRHKRILSVSGFVQFSNNIQESACQREINGDNLVEKNSNNTTPLELRSRITAKLGDFANITNPHLLKPRVNSLVRIKTFSPQMQPRTRLIKVPDFKGKKIATCSC